jgi:flagella basal body P-ring formation protein FlgA
MIPLAAFAISGCFALSPAADQIRAGDLARSMPEWSAIAADTPIVPAPIPGVQRVFHVSELQRLAAHWNVAWSAPEGLLDVCFQIPVAAPDPAHMLAAMRRQLPEARIEVLESSRQPAPEGDFEFPLSGLHGNYWNGSVTWGRGRKFMVWARVNVAVSMRRVVAAEDLKVGKALEAGQLRLETVDGIPTGNGFLTSVASAEGRIVRRTIAAGTAIRADWLEAPKDIQRGETVQVEVIEGAARLRLEGVAVSAGTVGQLVQVENPASKRRFAARVEGKGKVVVK